MRVAFLRVVVDDRTWKPTQSLESWVIANNAISDGFLVAGVLACLDGYMNIALEQTEEYVNGQLKNKYGDAFIRGNNGKYHSVQYWVIGLK